MKDPKIQNQESTKILTRDHFLLGQSQTIQLKKEMTLGRSSNSDVVINDEKLSALHCRFLSQGNQISVIDLGSTNGVYVNKMRIPSEVAYEVKLGDRVQLGSSEFTLSDTEVLPSSQPAEEKKFSFNPLSFFNAPMEWVFVYLLMLLIGICSFIINLQLDIRLPKELFFLSDHYLDMVIPEGFKSLLLIYTLSIGHSLVVRFLLKKRFPQILSGILYIGLLLTLVNFRYGPAWYVKKYLLNRDYILETASSSIEASKITAAEKNVLSAYKKISRKINSEEKKILSSDLEKIQKLAKEKRGP